MAGFSMVELPYKGERIVMQILLPDEGFGTSACEEVEQNLILHDIEETFEMNKWSQLVHFSVPKFRIETEIPLLESLSKLGMTDMFDSPADFTGMDSSGLLYVTEIKQKAFIEVNTEIQIYILHNYKII